MPADRLGRPQAPVQTLQELHRPSRHVADRSLRPLRQEATTQVGTVAALDKGLDDSNFFKPDQETIDCSLTHTNH
jgi:hypothetical protein